MPKIGRFPPFGKRFFKRARKLIGCCHFSHFWRVVVAIAAIDRTFRPDGRPFDKKRLSTYGPNTLRRLGRWHTVPNKKNHRLADRGPVQDVEAALGTGRLPILTVPGCRTIPTSRDDRPSPADPPGM